MMVSMAAGGWNACRVWNWNTCRVWNWNTCRVWNWNMYRDGIGQMMCMGVVFNMWM